MTRLRSIIFFLYLAITTTIMGIVCLPIIWLGVDAARATIRLWARMMLGGLSLICGVSHRIEGAEHMPTGGAIVAANHQSMWETIAFFAMLPRPSMVFKRELLAIPIYRWWGKGSGVGIVIDRAGGAKALRELTAKAAQKLEAGEQVIVFPEGTRVAVGEKRRLRPGVAGIYLAGAFPCVPVAHNSGEHWRHPGGLKTPGEIIVRFLPAIEPGLDRKTFMTRLDEALTRRRPDLAVGGKEAPNAETPAAAVGS